MSDHIPTSTVRLWTLDGFRDDDWRHAESADALSGHGRFILPLKEFLRIDVEKRISARERLGVLLMPGDALAHITGFIDQLALVALAYPAFSDGRSYSKAELLRSRHDFQGIVRATGEILVDQMPHMLRVGFDQFEVTDPVLITRLQAGDVGGIALCYQPSARPASPGPKYAWRRFRADQA